MSGSAAFVLSAAFGQNTAFSVTSDVRTGTRTFSSFSDAVAANRQCTRLWRYQHCKEGQGYLFNQPLPALEFSRLLASRMAAPAVH
jgi:hypothetical protein